MKSTKAQPLSDLISVYQYTLIRKWKHQTAINAAIAAPAALLLIVEAWLSGLHQAVLLPVCYVFILALHAGISVTILKFRPEGSDRNWSFHGSFPWIGYLPRSFIPLDLLLAHQLQLAGIGLAVIAVCQPWVSSLLLFNLLFLHLWAMAPRLLVLLLFRLKKQGGLVKINQTDVSYYMP